MNLFRTFAEMKFFIYSDPNGRKYILYEVLPEEGDEVKKKLMAFKYEEEAIRARETMVDKYTEFLGKRFNLRNKDVKAQPPAIKDQDWRRSEAEG